MIEGMRNIASFCLAIVVVCLCNSPTLALDSNKPKEPEYIGVFFRLNVTNADLTPLERQSSKARMKIKGLGFAGGESIAEIEGERSSVRFDKSEKLEFIVKLASQEIDPLSQIQMFSLQSVKGKRQISLAKANPMGIGGRDTSGDRKLMIDVAKYGASSFKVTASQSLEPGEYVLGLKNNDSGFCFGVDGPVQAPVEAEKKEGSKSKTKTKAAKS